MGYERHYVGKSGPDLDRDAISDLRDYVSQDQWDTLQQAVGQLTAGSLTFKQFNFLFGIAGVTGRPFHAFCRRYCLEEYRAWMAEPSSEAPEGIQTDEAGFRIEETE